MPTLQSSEHYLKKCRFGLEMQESNMIPISLLAVINYLRIYGGKTFSTVSKQGSSRR